MIAYGISDCNSDMTTATTTTASNARETNGHIFVVVSWAWAWACACVLPTCVCQQWEIKCLKLCAPAARDLLLGNVSGRQRQRQGTRSRTRSQQYCCHLQWRSQRILKCSGNVLMDVFMQWTHNACHSRILLFTNKHFKALLFLLTNIIFYGCGYTRARS